MILWNKHPSKKVQLSLYFDTKELQCKCRFKDCVEQRVSIELLKSLDKLRMEYGGPITVTSAYRCSRHQEKIRNSGISTVVAKLSTHELGEAVDIKAKDMKKLRALAAKHFKAIGTAKTFIHVDMRADKVRRWNY